DLTVKECADYMGIPERDPKLKNSNFAIRVHAGSEAFDESDGAIWVGDASLQSAPRTRLQQSTEEIKQTKSSFLYQSARIGPSCSPFTNVPAGRHAVVLKVAEIESEERGAEGKRVFDVIINTKPMKTGLDVAREAHGRFIAYDLP